MFWRGANACSGAWHFGEASLQCFGGVWYFGGGACSCLGGVAFWRVLAVFWRGVELLEGACSVTEGCGIFLGRLQCFEGVWHFWRRHLQSFGGGACRVLEGCGILRTLAVLQHFGGASHFGEAACSG